MVGEHICSLEDEDERESNKERLEIQELSNGDLPMGGELLEGNQYNFIYK